MLLMVEFRSDNRGYLPHLLSEKCELVAGATVMGSLLESGPELLQLHSNQHFTKQEIWVG